MRNTLAWIFVATILTVMGLLMAKAAINDSPTSDEPPHILSGYVFLRYGHNFIDQEHPLLAKSMAAAPLLFQNLKNDLSDSDYSQQRYVPDVGKMFDHSRNFLIYGGNNPDQILFWSRLPMIFLTLAFGFVVFLLARKFFGNFVGMVALFFYATEPLFLANGPLVNTDIAAAGFIITSVYALVLYSERQSHKRLVFLGLTLTAALLSKFSTFYLLPISLLLMLFIYHQKNIRLYSHLGILVALVFGLISIFYGVIGFQDTGLLGFIPIRFFAGLIGSVVTVSTSDRFTYLLGESYFGSKIYYFPILIATKTQLLTLFGILLSLILFWQGKIHLTRVNAIFFFTPFLIFLGLALVAKFNIGVRHVAPLYPFFVILAAAGFVGTIRILTKNLASNLKLSTISLVLLALVCLRGYSILTTYPHFLSYYNFVAGGTNNGWKVANDANYDWGQDVKRLAEFVRDNNINSLAFDNYTGVYAAKDYYDLPAFQFYPDQKTHKGYLALSTSVITFYEDKPKNYSWVVDNYKPIAKAGKSIFIYKIE